jgi:hypothetical protein
MEAGIGNGGQKYQRCKSPGGIAFLPFTQSFTMLHDRGMQ